MKTKLNIERAKAITAEQVMQVYSGRPGCMCGCRGNYRFNPEHLEAVTKLNGYAPDAKNVNLTQVKKVVRLLKEQIENGNSTVTIDFGRFRHYVYAEVNGRAYAMYLVTSAACTGA